MPFYDIDAVMDESDERSGDGGNKDVFGPAENVDAVIMLSDYVNKCKYDSHSEKTGRNLPEPVGIDNDLHKVKYGSDKYHNEFLSGDNDEYPSRNGIIDEKADKNCDKHELISERIEHLTDRCRPVIPPCEITIQQVRQEGYCIDDDACNILRIQEHINKYADKQNSYAGQNIGDMPHNSYLAFDNRSILSGLFKVKTNLY